jgi:hypothetical protein
MRIVDTAITTGFAAWFVATAVSQHPDRSFERARELDRTGSGVMIPNWRFFAPNPAVEDQHFLYRLASADHREHTPWRAVFEIEPRRLMHAFWFPGRRQEKAIFDVASTLLENRAASVPVQREAGAAAQRLVKDFVRHRIEPEEGFPLFQVLLVRYAGHDHSEAPIYDMIFDYEEVVA